MEVHLIRELIDAFCHRARAVLHRLDELDFDTDEAARAAGRGDGGEDIECRVVAGKSFVPAPGRGLEVDGLELGDEVGEKRAEQLGAE